VCNLVTSDKFYPKDKIAMASQQADRNPNHQKLQGYPVYPVPVIEIQ
jgi:hypothetical protein